MLFIPIGLDQTTVRRLPWVSFGIIALNFVAFLTLGIQVRNAEEEINQRGREVMAYWAQHSYLAFPTKLLPDGMSESERERITTLAEGMKSLSGKAPVSDEEQAREQQELDRLVERVREAVGYHPFKAWGLIPAHPRAIAFLTSMFLHSGWLHLLGNMLFFYISGPFIEDAYGRPLFAALYVASGVVSSLVHIAAFRGSEVPLVGASGAIAGIMGAFLVRFVRARIRFFYAYFVFIVRSGTVDLPAWIVLPLWFLQQLFFAGLAAASGVAYRAHVGGFAFGFLVALAIKQLRIEERLIAPGIEREISVMQNPALDEGMELLARGDTAAARDAFGRVLRSEPRNADAHLGIWQSHCQDGTASKGAEHLVRAMDEELKRGDVALALAHWREMVAATRQGGPGALRFRLATMLEPLDRDGAVEVLRHLSQDASAGLLAEKAARRLTALGAKPPVPLAPAPPPPAAPEPVRVMASAVVGKPVEPPTVSQPAGDVFGVDRDADRAVEGLPSLVFPDAETKEVTVTEAHKPAGHVVEECALEIVQPEGLMLRGLVGGPELLPFVEVEKVCVAGIAGSQRPYLVLDLMLHATPGQPRTVERLVSSQFDPRHLIGRLDLPPLEAFRELVRIIAEASHAEVTPPTFFVPSAKIPTFASVEAYERDILRPLL